MNKIGWNILTFSLANRFLGETPSRDELTVMDALGCGGATDWSELGTVPVMSELTEILKVVLNNKVETWKV